MFLENTLMDSRRAAAAGGCRMDQGFTVRLPPSRICVRCPPQSLRSRDVTRLNGASVSGYRMRISAFMSGTQG
jgi:hypothetical protein